MRGVRRHNDDVAGGNLAAGAADDPAAARARADNFDGVRIGCGFGVLHRAAGDHRAAAGNHVIDLGDLIVLETGLQVGHLGAVHDGDADIVFAVVDAGD